MKREKLFLKTRRSGKFLSRHRRKDQSTKGAKRLRKCYKSIKEVWTLMESLNVEEGQEIFQKRWMKSFPLKCLKLSLSQHATAFPQTHPSFIGEHLAVHVQIELSWNLSSKHATMKALAKHQMWNLLTRNSVAHRVGVGGMLVCTSTHSSIILMSAEVIHCCLRNFAHSIGDES